MNSRFLKRTLAVIAFIAIAFLGDRLLSVAAASAVESSQFRLSRIYRGDVDADILVLGNSRGVHSLYAPRLSEATCSKAFNAAYNGLSVQMMLVVFKDYLERNRRAKFVLIEMSTTADWEKSGEEFKTYAPLSPRLQRVFELTNREYPYWSRITQLYHFDTELFLRSLFYMRGDDQEWIIGERRITEDAKQTFRGVEASSLDRRQRRTIMLGKIAEFAREAGVQPVFFIAPYHPVAFDRTPDLEAWARDQREVAGDVPLLDFSRAVQGDDAFADPIHLNHAGSDQLIARLLDTDIGRSLSACSGQDATRD